MFLPPGLLPVAHQLHASLLREIDHEIEIERLVGDARYGRDVLLVCDACPGTDLPGLAAQWRALLLTRQPTLADAQRPAQTSSAPMGLPAMPPTWTAGSEFGQPDDDTQPGLPASLPRHPHHATTPASWLRRWWARWRRR